MALDLIRLALALANLAVVIALLVMLRSLFERLRLQAERLDRLEAEERPIQVRASASGPLTDEQVQQIRAASRNAARREGRRG
jgi:hypothetical protein